MKSGVRLGDLILMEANALDLDQQTGLDTSSHVTVPSGCMQPCKKCVMSLASQADVVCALSDSLCQQTINHSCDQVTFPVSRGVNRQ